MSAAAEAAPRCAAMAIPLWILQALALWIAAMAGCVGAGMAIHVNLPPPMADGPLTTEQAFLVVNGLIAIVLALVASTARLRGVKLGLLVFFAYFAIASAMMQIETLWFNESLKLPLPVIGQLVASSAIQAAVMGVAAALLFHPAAAEATPVPARLTLRIAILALVYVVLYYGAGGFIAWQSAAVRAYYENGIHIAFAPTLLFQVLRGTLWAIITLVIVTRLKGSLMRRALVMGVLFPVLTAGALLYPTSFFPWPVRAAHLMEIGTSEFLYGIVATLLLLAGGAKHPLTNSIWRRLAGQA